MFIPFTEQPFENGLSRRRGSNPGKHSKRHEEALLLGRRCGQPASKTFPGGVGSKFATTYCITNVIVKLQQQLVLLGGIVSLFELRRCSSLSLPTDDFCLDGVEAFFRRFVLNERLTDGERPMLEGGFFHRPRGEDRQD